MWVQSLGQEDPLEKQMARGSSILAWRIPVDRGAWWATADGVAKSRQVHPVTKQVHTHTHTHTHTQIRKGATAFGARRCDKCASLLSS